MDALDQQRDLSASICPGDCEVIDDSPAFSPDGRQVAFNRKNGGGLVDERNGLLLTSVSGDDCRVLLPEAAGTPTTPATSSCPTPRSPGRTSRATRPGRRTAPGWSSAPARRRPSTPRETEPVGHRLRRSRPAHHDPAGASEGAQRPAVGGPGGARPDTVPAVTVDTTTDIRVDVVNNGPAASPGTTLTIARRPARPSRRSATRAAPATPPPSSAASGGPARHQRAGDGDADRARRRAAVGGLVGVRQRRRPADRRQHRPDRGAGARGHPPTTPPHPHPDTDAHAHAQSAPPDAGPGSG
ncbi:hypothetical protein NKH77_40725 [Streptomyces sp. M19]